MACLQLPHDSATTQDHSGHDSCGSSDGDRHAKGARRTPPSILQVKTTLHTADRRHALPTAAPPSSTRALLFRSRPKREDNSPSLWPGSGALEVQHTSALLPHDALPRRKDEQERAGAATLMAQTSATTGAAPNPRSRMLLLPHLLVPADLCQMPDEIVLNILRWTGDANCVVALALACSRFRFLSLLLCDRRREGVRRALLSRQTAERRDKSSHSGRHNIGPGVASGLEPRPVATSRGKHNKVDDVHRERPAYRHALCMATCTRRVVSSRVLPAGGPAVPRQVQIELAFELPLPESITRAAITVPAGVLAVAALSAGFIDSGRPAPMPERLARLVVGKRMLLLPLRACDEISPVGRHLARASPSARYGIIRFEFARFVSDQFAAVPSGDAAILWLHERFTLMRLASSVQLSLPPPPSSSSAGSVHPLQFGRRPACRRLLDAIMRQVGRDPSRTRCRLLPNNADYVAVRVVAYYTTPACGTWMVVRLPPAASGLAGCSRDWSDASATTEPPARPIASCASDSAEDDPSGDHDKCRLAYLGATRRRRHHGSGKYASGRDRLYLVPISFLEYECAVLSSCSVSAGDLLGFRHEQLLKSLAEQDSASRTRPSRTTTGCNKPHCDPRHPSSACSADVAPSATPVYTVESLARRQSAILTPSCCTAPARHDGDGSDTQQAGRLRAHRLAFELCHGKAACRSRRATPLCNCAVMLERGPYGGWLLTRILPCWRMDCADL
jgi:hypothetical protein